MKASEIPTIGLGNPGFKGGKGEIETDKEWFEHEHASPNSEGDTEQAERQEPEEIHNQSLHAAAYTQGTARAETLGEGELRLLSAIETACRDIQNYCFAKEKPAQEVIEASVLHLYLWLFAVEVCGRDSWDLTRWAAAPHPNSPNIGDRDQVSRLADLVVPRD
jgi:hypothetical protein